MFLIRRPEQKKINEFLLTAQGLPFTYTEVGMTAVQCPAGYRIDHSRVTLGRGPEKFDRATNALKQWRQFDLGWVKLFPEDAPLTVGATVAVLVKHSFLWSLNACRIVYLIDDNDGINRRLGFAYGTTLEHAERGEERFMIEWRPSDDTVSYDILAYSRPQHWLAGLAYPLTRWWQKRFARESLKAMRRHVSPEKG